MSDPAAEREADLAGRVFVSPSEGGGGDGLASIVERSTTAACWMDGLETGWTEPHVHGTCGTQKDKKHSPCQGEGRGFESRLPLSSRDGFL